MASQPSSAPVLSPDPAPNPQLLAALGRLVRGLSALFWGLPIALIVCAQTAKGDWLQPLGVFPPLAVTTLLVYGLLLLGRFQQQERIWVIALERAKLFSVVNVGLSPFLYWWGKIPHDPFYGTMVQILTLSALFFLFMLNPMLARLAAMLPDETLRLETRLFTQMNRWILSLTIAVVSLYFVLSRLTGLPVLWVGYLELVNRSGSWIILFLVLLPIAMTMALIWKTKEVIMSSVFGPEA